MKLVPHAQQSFSSTPLKAFFTSRLIIIVILVLSSGFAVQPTPAKEGVIYNPVMTVSVESVGQRLATILQAADAGWYLGIATRGYDDVPSPSPLPRNWTFFPLFPLVTHGLALLIGSPLIAGLLVSNLCFLAALLLLHRYQLSLGDSEETADRTCWLLCCFPTSYFFSAPFTESLFLLLTVAAFAAVHERRYPVGGLWMALATATRPTGLLILPAFGLRILRARAFFTLPGLLALVVAPLGALGYMGYLYSLTGDPLAFATNQLAWNRGQRGVGDLLLELVRHPGRAAIAWDFVWLNVASVLLACAVTLKLIFERRYSWALLVGIPIAAALLTGNLVSMTRFVMALFPVFIVLGRWTKSSAAERAVLASFTALLALMTALYAQLVTAAMT